MGMRIIENKIGHDIKIVLPFRALLQNVNQIKKDIGRRFSCEVKLYRTLNTKLSTKEHFV